MSIVSPRSRRQTILLVGMHRAGTSALTRIISGLGAYAGESADLMGADDANPTGYWERIDVVSAHEYFLKDNGYAWRRVAGFDLAATTSESKTRCRDLLRQIVAQIGEPDRPLLVKDPRLCLLLPLWDDVVESPFHVLAVRDPRTIAMSLHAVFPRSFTTHFLLALWQKYLLSALRALRGRRVLFVSYSNLLADREREIGRLAAALREIGVCLPAAPMSALGGLLDSRLNRSVATEHDLSSAQEQLQQWLLTQCEAPGAVTCADAPELDPPDATLREFEIVRENSYRLGVQAGLRQAAKPGA